MSPIQKALSDIKRRIPKEILETVFLPKRSYHMVIERFLPTTIENRIREEIIEGRVREDCDITGGTEVYIPLSSIQPEVSGEGMWVYVIPKTLMQGRRIVSALSIAFGPINPDMGSQIGVTGSTNYNQMELECNHGGYTHLSKEILYSNTPMQLNQSAQVRLIGENVILVEDNIRPTSAWLRCKVSADDEFSHLNPRSWLAFSHLCVLATKAYIYNNYIIKMGDAELKVGFDLGVFKQIVEGYADADEMYREYLEQTWIAKQFMNDRHAFNRFIKGMVGKNF